MPHCWKSHVTAQYNNIVSLLVLQSSKMLFFFNCVYAVVCVPVISLCSSRCRVLVCDRNISWSYSFRFCKNAVVVVSYSKTCLKRPLKINKTKVFKTDGSLIQVEHSAILLTCTKRISVLKTKFWSFFEWPLQTGFTNI